MSPDAVRSVQQGETLHRLGRHGSEQKLFVMYLEHRMRTFQGTFHASLDYAMWYGWSEMQRDLTEIKEEAARLRREQGKATVKPAAMK